MKKRLILIVIVFFCTAKQRVNSIEGAFHPANFELTLRALNLKGNVKRVDAKIYKASGRRDNIVIGRLDSLGTYHDQYPCVFNQKGLLVSTSDYHFVKKKELRKEFVYGKSDRVKEQRIYLKDSLVSSVFYNYSGDTLWENVEINASGDTGSVARHFYTIENDTVRIVYYNNNTPTGTSLRLLNGDIICDYTKSGNPKFELKKEYQNKMIVRSTIKSYSIKDSASAKMMTTIFNEHGDPLKRTSTNGSKAVVSWSYTYDENDNWTEQVYYINYRVRLVIKREIEYYE